MDGCAAAQAQVGADALQLVAVARRQAQGRAGAGKLQRQFARDYRGGAHNENFLHGFKPGRFPTAG
jgi:hypothetical protein